MDTKTCAQIFISALFVIAKWKEWPSAGKWVDKVCYIHTMEYYSAVKRNELQIRAKTWTNLENIVLSQRSHAQKTTYHIIPFMWNVHKVYAKETGRGMVVAWRGGTAGILTVNRHEVSYWDEGDILKLFLVIIAQLGTLTLEIIEFYTVNYMIHKIYLNNVHF